jgi:hypothetical protein
VPQQSANGAPDPKAGRVGSVRLGRRVGETSGVDMDEIRSGTGPERTEHGHATPSMVVTGRPPKVTWRFAPDDEFRRQRLLRLLFDQDD